MLLDIRKMILLLGVCLSAWAQEEAPLTGVILDANGHTMEGVRITVENREAHTDANGRFQFKKMPSGVHNLNVHVSGQIFQTQAIAAEESQLTFTLPEDDPVSANTAVVGGAYTIDMTGQNPDAQHSGDEINRMPALGTDLFRQLSYLPGVESDGRSALFSAQGSNPGETLFLLDGMEIQMPLHDRRYDSFFSAIDGAALSRVTLFQGGPTSEYGDTTGPVLEMETANGEDSRTEVNINFMNTGIMRRGSFAEGRGSYLVSARRSFGDELIEEFINDRGLPYFFDTMAAVSYDLHPKHRLSANVFYVFDDEDPEDNDRVEEYKDRYLWLTLQSQFTDRLSVRSILYRGKLERDENDYFFSDDFLPEYLNNSEYSYTGLKQDWRWSLNDKHSFKWGFDLRDIDAEASFRLPFIANFPNNDPIEIRDEAQAFEGDSLGLYGAWRWQTTDRLTLELGIRRDAQSWTDEDQWTPRIHGNWQINDASRLSYSAMLSSQVPGINERTLGLALGVEPYYALQHNLEYQRRVGTRGKLRAAVWHKVYDDVDNFYGGHTVNGGLLSYQDQIGRFSYGLSYNYSDPGTQIGWATQAAPGKGHGGKINLGMRLGKRWHLALNYMLGPGRMSDPYEMTLVPNDNGQLVGRLVFNEDARRQLAAIHQANFRITRDFNPRRGKGLSIYLDVLNVFSRENELDLIPTAIFPYEGEAYVFDRIETSGGARANIGITWRF